MIDLKNKYDCCGCYACNSICPKQCISMKVDNEGFWYPEIDLKSCINCGLCEKVCPQLNDLDYINNIYSYACKNKNINEKEKSSSGGVFGVIAKYVIENNGVVFGAAFNEKFELEHCYVDSIREYKKLRGSKYVQSKIGNSYLETKKYLEEGRLVLFSGTQCQIKGLNLFLNNKYDNLITIDVVCHGVPSPKVFSKYIKEKTFKYKSNIENVEFRNKKLGWENFMFSIEFTNKKKYERVFFKDVYMKGFLENLYLRPSCYLCKSKNFSSGSDFSLADYWGIKNVNKDFYDESGVSAVICNNENSREILKKISSNLDIIDTDINNIVNNNPCVIRPSKYNNKRNEFFKYIEEEKIEKYIKKYITLTKYQKFKAKLRRIINNY